MLNDGILNYDRGGSHPVLNLNERVLSVLACKHVDDVILDPPYCVTREMIAALNISVVVTGKLNESRRDDDHAVEEVFRAAKDMGIFHVLDRSAPLRIDCHPVFWESP